MIFINFEQRKRLHTRVQSRLRKENLKTKADRFRSISDYVVHMFVEGFKLGQSLAKTNHREDPMPESSPPRYYAVVENARREHESVLAEANDCTLLVEWMNAKFDKPTRLKRQIQLVELNPDREPIEYYDEQTPDGSYETRWIR